MAGYEAKIKEGETDAEFFCRRYYDLLDALRDLPDLPSHSVLSALGHAGKFPGDWDLGKRIQRERGLSAVPPVTECEIGAGFWRRVVKPA